MKKLITIEELKKRIPDFITSFSDVRTTGDRYDALLSRKSITDQIVLPFETRLDLEVMSMLICNKFSLKALVDPYEIVSTGTFCSTRVLKLTVEFVDGKASYLNIELAKYTDQIDTLMSDDSRSFLRAIRQMLPTEQPSAPALLSSARRRFIADSIATNGTVISDDPHRIRSW